MSKATQGVDGKNNQVAGGDINNVRLEVSVPSPHLHAVGEQDSEAWERELEKHAKFRRSVGIECSRRARLELEPLLTEHNFTARQLKIVWRNGSLHYDEDRRELVVKPSRMEALWGLLLFCFSMLLVSPTVIAVVTSDIKGLGAAAFMVAFGAYTLGMAYLARQHIAPYRIAKRLVPALAAQYGRE